VTVTVTDIDAQLIASASYPDGNPLFVNTYRAAAANTTIMASKSAIGANLEAGAFSFGLYNEDGNEVLMAVNDGNGNIFFPDLTFDQPGTFSYTIREITPSGNGWSTDETAYPVTITVADNAEGQLVADVSYPNGIPAFANSYSASPATVILTGKKTVIGGSLMAGAFVFGVFDQNGTQVAITTNQADGSIVFPALSYTAPGVYWYTIQELSPHRCGWVTDDSVFFVTVTVTDDGQGNLIAAINYNDNLSPVFVNRYCPPRCDHCPCRWTWGQS
jgi:pilin isopeptide linkage protein